MHRKKYLTAVAFALALIPALAFAQITSKPAETALTPAITTTPVQKDVVSRDRTGADTAAPVGFNDGEETHPALNLSPDKSELVRLNRDASSVIVGNPAHAAVMLDTPRLAVVIPRAAGSTYFTVLDKDGEVIMQRHIIVAAPKKNYVRVRRSCANVPAGTACQPTSVYFCPDMCHEIGASGAADAAADPAASAMGE